jgi:hypothetical protein
LTVNGKNGGRRPHWADEGPPFVSGGKLNEIPEEQALREAQELEEEMEEYRRQGAAELAAETSGDGGEAPGESSGGTPVAHDKPRRSD